VNTALNATGITSKLEKIHPIYLIVRYFVYRTPA